MTNPITPALTNRRATCGCLGFPARDGDWFVAHELGKCRDPHGRVLTWDEFVLLQAQKTCVALDEPDPRHFVDVFVRETNAKGSVSNLLVRSMFDDLEVR